MSYMEGYCRSQRLLLPDLLEDYVTEEPPVRLSDAYVESRDLERLGVARAHAALTGRPAYDPRDLLKLYIYGDLNRLRSRRRREREPHRHVELMGRLRQLRPACKTRADFRQNHPKARRALFRAFVRLGKQLDLLGAERLAIDGSPFKAVHNTHQNFTKTKLEKALQDIDAQVAKYVTALDASDREASSGHQPTSAELQKPIESLQERQQRYHGFVPEMTARGATQLARTDPASRSMPKSPKVEVGYTVQIAVDRTHKRMVEQDVPHAGTDDDQLSPLAMRAKETLGGERMRAVAELGYEHGQEINACDEAGIDASVPHPSTSANTTRGLFGKERFTYAPARDGYCGPAGEELTFRCETPALGRPIRDYATGACRRCPLREQGTRNKDGRRLTRWVDEHSLERMEERLQATPELMQERKPLVEHPFGTIKHAKDQSYFLRKGLKPVRAEFSRACLAYNLKRVRNLLGVPRLLGALGSGGHLLDVCPRERRGRRRFRCPDRECPPEHVLPDPTTPQVSVSFHTVWR